MRLYIYIVPQKIWHFIYRGGECVENQLKIGKMTVAELAEWFGVTKKAYTNARAKYLEKLKLFADFSPIHGGVLIEEIYQSVYDKNLSQDDEKLFQEIQLCIQDQEGLASIAGIGRKLAVTEEEFQNLSISQRERRLSFAAKRQFGEYCAFDSAITNACAGPKGRRERIWAIKLGNDNKYRHLTEQEQELWYDLLKEWNSDKSGAQVEKEIIAIEQLSRKEISPAQFLDTWFELNDDSFYNKTIQMFKMKTGLQIVFIARYEIGNFTENAF